MRLPQTFILLLVAGLVVGCSSSHPGKQSAQPIPAVLTDEQLIQRAKQRFPLLRPDMDVRQAFATLGLSYDRILSLDLNAVSPTFSGESYWIPGGQILDLVFAGPRGNRKLVRAQLQGAVWSVPISTERD